jgi:hypothetical protein
MARKAAHCHNIHPPGTKSLLSGSGRRYKYIVIVPYLIALFQELRI